MVTMFVYYYSILIPWKYPYKTYFNTWTFKGQIRTLGDRGNYRRNLFLQTKAEHSTVTYCAIAAVKKKRKINLGPA